MLPFSTTPLSPTTPLPTTLSPTTPLLLPPLSTPPRCTLMRSPPTPTTTPSPMTTPSPTSTLASPTMAPVLLRDLTPLPFPTAVCSTLPTTPTTSTATSLRSPTRARLSTPRPSLLLLLTPPKTCCFEQIYLFIYFNKRQNLQKK